MKKLIMAAGMLLPLLTGITARAQWDHIATEGVISRDTFSRNGYTLVFINMDADFNTATGKRMVDAFFTVYPKQAKEYNAKTMKHVVFIIDPGYTGVAATAGGIVRINPKWMKDNPNDIDVVTHEVMHIVQGYPGNSGPGWITEGIADYVRYSMGVDNVAGGWSLPAYSNNQHYENAYRVTARFLAWIEAHKKKGFVQKLDAAMRTATYTPAFWKDNTGSSVEDLWKEYAANPAL